MLNHRFYMYKKIDSPDFGNINGVYGESMLTT